jgi:hypothetical protein
MFPKKPRYHEFIGNSTLLYGETDTKKTLNTSEFVKFLLEIKKINPKEISILDFAPKLEIINNLKIGGKVVDYYDGASKCNNILIKGKIIPPRLNANNKKELYMNACNNYKETSTILEVFNANPTEILIINDISIYLHLGSKKYLLETILKSKTFYGNSYYGGSINQNFTKLFSLREKSKVRYLIKHIELSYKTQKED